MNSSETYSKIPSQFESTTELATRRYVEKVDKKGLFNDTKQKRLFIEQLHDAVDDDGESCELVKIIKTKAKNNGIRMNNRDKYYAVLFMDGDRMGDLINGKSISATWNTVLHQKLSERFMNPSFCENTPIRQFLDKKRTINPALHAMISESLNSFARHGVAPEIKRRKGRLIYAGGDDICAVLPLDTVLDAADRIRKIYQYGFVAYGKNGAEELNEKDFQGVGRIGMHLGKTEGISISGAIIIAHHKEPLREVLRDGREVLENIAKKRAGRDALAIRLKKRSGGDRDVWFKWDEKNDFANSEESLYESFTTLSTNVADDIIGTGLLYRIAALENAVRVVAGADLKSHTDDVLRLFKYEVEHSGKSSLGNDEIERLSRLLAGLCIREVSSEKRLEFNPEAAIIAAFLARKKEDAL